MKIVSNEPGIMENRSVEARATRARALSFLMGVSTVALVSGGFATPACAQTAPADTAQTQVSTSQEATPAPDTTTAAKDVVAAGEVIVTGRRAALQNADDRKRRSETIIDSVVADDAGKLPDNSITEVLQRVAGVSIVRFAALGNPDSFSVEGSGIQVRGLSGVASRLNGREIFSANNGRAILWGDVTPELMSAVDVYKASTADLIEGGTGGQIDLRTKLPFDFKGGLHVSGSGDLSRGDLARKNDASVSGLITDSWDTPIGKIGLLADLASSRLTSLSDFFRMEPYFKTHINNSDYYVPGGYDYGDQYFQRKRTGIYAAAQWAPADSLTFTGTFFQTHYHEFTTGDGSFVTSQTLSVDPSDSTFDSSGALLKTGAVFQRDPATFLPSTNPITSGGNIGVGLSSETTRDYSLSFMWKPADSRLAIKGSLQRVDSKATANSLDVFRNVNFPSSFGLDLTGKLPVVTEPAGTQAILNDPSQYFWSASMPHNSNDKGRLDAAQLDAEYTLDSGFFRSIKIGGRYSKRTERDFDNGYNWSALGVGWNGDPQLTFANAAPGDIEGHDFKNFFHGHAVLPGNQLFPSYALVSQMNRIKLTTPPPAGFCTADEQFNCSASGPLPTTGYGGLSSIRTPGFILPDDQTDDLTETVAGYALVRFGNADGSGISGNVGARVIHFRNQSEGYYTQNATTFIRDGQTLTLAQHAGIIDDGAKFTHVLPSINLDYAPSSKTKVRFGYNITLDNASFNALRAQGSLGVATTTNPGSTDQQQLPPFFTNFTTSSGNPKLKPVISNNFDLSFEYYGRAGTTLHLAPFYKRLSNVLIYTLTEQPITVYYTDGTSEQAVGAATDAANSSKKATVKGVEVGGRTFFDMLPGVLSGFGVEANFTYIESSNPGDIYRDISGVAHSDAPLVGLSKYNVNATLLYERKRVSARIAYSWRSKYLQTTNSNGTNPTYAFYDAANAASQSIQIALPVYGAAYGTIDLGVRFKFNDHLSVGVQATNVTNATAKTLMGGYPGGNYVRSWFQSDRRISGQVGIAF